MGRQIKYAIILAGGRGTRLSEQTQDIPKPLVEVGNVPIIEHVINHLASYGVTHVVIAGGYKVHLIKEYFLSDRHKYQGDLYLDKDGVHSNQSCIPGGLESLIIADTGLSTGTAQRIKKAKELIPDGEPFFMTYGDSVSDVNLNGVIDELNNTSADMVLTAIRYRERFGVLHINDSSEVTKFVEKSMSEKEFINGGFIACESNVVDYIEDTDDDFSGQTMPRIQRAGKLNAYVHDGFWAAMDTQRDWEELNKIYENSPELFLRKNGGVI